MLRCRREGSGACAPGPLSVRTFRAFLLVLGDLLRSSSTAPQEGLLLVISIARRFSVCRAKNLLICLVFLAPRPSKLAAGSYPNASLQAQAFQTRP